MEAVCDLASLMADGARSTSGSRPRWPRCGTPRLGWRIVDDTLQIKGGRGYETADSLRSRGEKPDPVERMMRDFRINLIFEGSSEIMRLFIAREAVDTHFKVAGALIDPKAPVKAEAHALLKAALFYATWYPRLWLGLRGRLGFGEFGTLATHMRFVERSSRKLARTLFHCMVRFGPEAGEAAGGAGPAGGDRRGAVRDGGGLLPGAKRQGGRAARRQAMPSNWPMSSAARPGAGWRRSSRRCGSNDDVATYAIARKVLDGEYTWLEQGMVGTREDLTPGRLRPVTLYSGGSYPPECTHGYRRRQDRSLHRPRGDRRRRARDLPVRRARTRRSSPRRASSAPSVPTADCRTSRRCASRTSPRTLRRAQEPQVLRDQLPERRDLPGARHRPDGGGPVPAADRRSWWSPRSTTPAAGSIRPVR